MKKENKILFKYFILIFLASALIINWNEISWIFNYKAIAGIVSNQFESKIIAKTDDISKKEGLSPIFKEFEETEKENGLEIPKIGISVPLVFAESQNEKDVGNALNGGAVHFPDSVLPGEAGQTIILGHSAPLGWPKIKYDWVFSRINELTEGDEILVYFDHRKYVFSVTGKFFLDRGEEVPELLTKNKNVLTLISCWPPGKDIKRIAVEAR